MSGRIHVTSKQREASNMGNAVSSELKTNLREGISPLAGQSAPRDLRIDPGRLERQYYVRRPDQGDAQQMVKFGTSGHRGSSLHGSFTEAHILAITRAICEYRAAHGPDGPLYMGKDTHALSAPAQRTALEVLAARPTGPPLVWRPRDRRHSKQKR
jgi:phosphoglucomutase/phosphomannomutase-like protein